MMVESRQSDPVTWVEVPADMADNDWGGPGWYFWDETWSRAYGPYQTREAASAACVEYAERL